VNGPARSLETALSKPRTRPLLTLVLGAGKGTRMKSALPKVMHQIAGRSMLGHVLATARAAGGTSIAVVVGPGMPEVAREAERWAPGAAVFVQEKQAGTGDAVLAARAAIARHQGDVLVMFGDTPLITVETLERLTAALDTGANVAVLGFHAADPTGYGRLVTGADGDLAAIREHNDATEIERNITLCNSGVLAFRTDKLLSILDRIAPNNAKAEYYLTDAVTIARTDGLRAVVVTGAEEEMLGVNSRAQLAAAEAVFQRRAREAAMAAGATLIAPETVWLSFDTRLGRDVIVEPNVFFGPGATVGDDVLIRANSHIEGASIGNGARIGPFARLRPGALLGTDVHIGNFVEVKAATMEAGSKANHLAYIGDGHVGAKANIGAGTIFCNYDGFNKHRTIVGAGAFVGSNAALVAPVRIGDGAYVGSGSVITKDVSANALALERAEQEERPGWAEKFRTVMTKRKK
jgi:bifunctional UDP-N-acetylglucosamine pyrophosphorylase/glucosamine-1-phosphate N-acetyltransferase